ncbi:MAG TPA: ABC transporter permease [Candidatus Saccharimonadales bacterium]|nr:ABC transporter permease [Candidatus Saccharimonadales bacterium]
MMPSSWQRLSGLILQELYVTRHRLEIIVDTFFFPLINVILFGYITHFIGTGGALNGQIFIVGVLWWQLLTVMQYNVTVSSMWNIWSHNLTNIFIAPISIGEYLLAGALSSALRTVAIAVLLFLGAWVVFDFDVLSLGWANMGLFTLNLLLFGCALGIAFLGVIFRFGVRIQAISWGAIYVIQPITAAFFPVAVLPGFLQVVAYALPPTYVFEAARQALNTPTVNWRYAGIAFVLNIGYVILSLLLFRYFFKKSKQSGQFARNDL